MKRYAEAKYRIYAQQRKQDTLVYNADDETLRAHFEGGGAFVPQLVPFSLDRKRASLGGACYAAMDGDWLIRVVNGREEKVITGSGLFKRSFRGRHNLENALAAVAATRAAGVDVIPIREALQRFAGVEHRQEYVRTMHGVDWINDSKATNLNALRQALDATPGKLVLIAGGRDKGDNLSDLEERVRQKVSVLVVFGESKAKFTEAFSSVVRVVPALSLEEAVEQAQRYASKGETVLFSPGCSSFDMFESFEERGMRFKKQVEGMLS